MFKTIFTSKKFWYAIVGVIVVITCAYSNIDAETLTQVLYSIVGIVIALIGGQAVADVGKEKEKIIKSNL